MLFKVLTKVFVVKFVKVLMAESISQRLIPCEGLLHCRLLIEFLN